MANITGTIGNDVINGTVDADVIDAGDGHDKVTAGGGNDVITLGAGNDWVNAGPGDDQVTGGLGNDTLTGDAGNDVLDGGEGNDGFFGGGGNDTLIGGAGNDLMYGDGANDSFDGGANDDKMYGGAGNDTFTIRAGEGADIVEGGLGVDTIVLDLKSADMTSALVSELKSFDAWSKAQLANAGGSLSVLAAQSTSSTFTFAELGGVKIAAELAVIKIDGTETPLGLIINEAPVANATASGATDEDVVLNGQIVASDPNGDTLSCAVDSGPSHGSIVMNAATGAYVYTPDANFNGTDTFTVKITDQWNSSITQTVNLTVAAVNDAPTVAATVSKSGVEDTAISGTVSGSDVDGDSISYHVSTGPSHGTLVINETSGAYTYTPDSNYNGSDSFVVIVKDQWNASSSQTVNLTVAAVNDAPTVAATVSNSGVEDTGISGTVSGSDIDGDSLTYHVSTGPSHGSVVINETSGAYTYTPTGNYSGSDSFVVMVKDPSGATALQTVNLSVSAVADAPAITAADLNVSASVNLTGTTGNDTLNGGSGDDFISGGEGNDTITGMGPANIAIAVGISAAVTDTDGSESIQSVVISGLGTSSTLSAGTKNVDGSWTLTAAQLSGLTLTTPDTTDLTLTITATSAEATGGTATSTVTQAITINRGTNADTLDGGGGNDVLTGGSGNNTLIGGSGNDTVNGGAGNDTFIAGLGNDKYDGGTGSDTINFSAATVAINVDLLLGTATGMGTDTVLNFENVIGSDFNDTIIGSNADGYFEGGLGNDDIRGGGGNDTILGEEGNDTIRGGAGNDIMAGGEGNDSLRGENGNDYMYADAGNDSYRGDAGTDTVDYSAAGAAITVNMAAGTVTGWGSDTLNTIEKIVGSSFDDYFSGVSRKSDIFDGGAGNDTFLGRTGSDILTGGTGEDTFIWQSVDFWGSRSTVGQDKITDFAVGEDVLDLTSLTAGGDPLTVFAVADTTTGTAITAVVSGRTYDVVLLEGVHGVTLSSLLADGSILA